MQDQKEESSMPDSMPELTKKMAEEIIQANVSYFKNKGLTPVGPVIGNENPAVIANMIASAKRGK